MGFLVEEVVLWQVPSEYFGFPSTVHQLFHTRQFFRAGTSPTQETKQEKSYWKENSAVGAVKCRLQLNVTGR
jgi:hypothetical protein